MSAIDRQANSLTMQHVREVFRLSFHLRPFLLRNVGAVSSCIFSGCAPYLLQRFASCPSQLSLPRSVLLFFCVCPFAPLLSCGLACAVLEIILPRSSNCNSPATSICIAIFDAVAVLKASLSFSVVGLHPVICRVQAAFFLVATVHS